MCKKHIFTWTIVSFQSLPTYWKFRLGVREHDGVAQGNKLKSHLIDSFEVHSSFSPSKKEKKKKKVKKGKATGLLF